MVTSAAPWKCPENGRGAEGRGEAAAGALLPEGQWASWAVGQEIGEALAMCPLAAHSSAGPSPIAGAPRWCSLLPPTPHAGADSYSTCLLKFSTPQPRLPIPQPLSIPPPEKYFWQVVILKQKGCLMCHCRERLRPVDEKNKYKADLIRIKPRQSETYTNLRSILVICHSRSVCPIYRLPSER